MMPRNRHLDVTFRHETFSYYPGEVTPAESREVRRVTGMGPGELWRMWMADRFFEPDVTALLIWMARKQTAKRLDIPELELPLDVIEATLTWDDLAEHLEVNFVGFDKEVQNLPEVVEEMVANPNLTAEVPVDPES